MKTKGFEGAGLSDVLDVKVFTLPHHSFASDEYLLGAGLLKNSVMEGAASTPAAEVARLLQQVLLWVCGSASVLLFVVINHC